MLKSLSLSAPILLLASGLAMAQMATNSGSHTTSSLASSDHWLASDIYKRAQASGWGQEGFPVVARVLEAMAGTELRSPQQGSKQ